MDVGDLVVILTALHLEYQEVRRKLTGPQVHRHERGTRFEAGTVQGTSCRVALGLTSRGKRKRLQTAVDLFTYVALPVICMTVFWCSPAVPPLLVALSFVQALALVVLGWQFLRYAER
ncbi:hypothetical protein [Streptomyces tremellae]|uniref:Uncharacterized protein n=1 Tax=Streptomyces tremellae TaxID=1124239 RepID=A0ABP7GAH0_9ACTN